jgi:hypothetical protein
MAHDAQQRARIIEMIGAVVLGGGLVAMVYELQGGGPMLSTASAERTGDDEVASLAADVDATPQADDFAPQADADGDDDGGAEDGVDEGPAPGDDENVPAWRRADEDGTFAAFPPVFDQHPPAFDDEAVAAYPKHGLVTGLAVILRERADLESPIIGVLHAGTRVRTDDERTFGGGCEQGWNRVFPRGWICRRAGLTVSDSAPEDGAVAGIAQPDFEAPLPFDYWRVKDEMTPFFHRLPSFEEQERADAAGAAWYAAHSREPMPTHPEERPADVPAVVKEYMNSGYYVTRAGEEVKSQRRFLRTQRGTYARKYQVRQKESPEFEGQLVSGAEALPMYFIRRAMPLMAREAEGSDVLVESELTPERLSTHPFVREITLGTRHYFEDGEGRLLRTYAVGKAYKLKRPPGIGPREKWVHIDLSEQTLVAYEGDEPQFATLVSTGKEPGMTPVGVHRVQTKYVATSMRDQPEEDEAYSIDDVPWTQYFHGSVALHGAFWHAGFGQVRSHGCVNLSPSDARWLFGFTDPPLPVGWHGVAPTKGTPKGSAVVVTE